VVDWEKVIQFALSQGPWAVAAVAIFYIYNRSQVKREADEKGDKELLMNVVTNNTVAMTKNTAATEASIQATRENIAVTNELRNDLARLSTGMHQDRHPQRRP